MKIKRAYKYRFYPTTEQEKISFNQTGKLLTKMKKQPEYEWLKEVSSVPLQQSLNHLQRAFLNFFAKRAKYPIFKSKHGKQSASYVTTAFKWDGERLKLAKMAEPLDIRWSRILPKLAKVTSINISKDPANRYFVSLICDDIAETKSKNTNKIGIDLGLNHFAILSTGEKI